MSREEVIKEIARAKRHTKMVVCTRKCLEDAGCYDRGYVVDANDHFVLMHLVTDDIRLEGYVALRLDDITEVKSEFDNHRFIEKALQLRKMAPQRPVLVDLNSMETILASVDEHFSLMVVHREAVDQSECHIGSLESIADKTFVMKEIDRDAQWCGVKRLRVDEVTRVEFNGGYETALAQVAGLD
jgi:hypothetical protein